MIRLPLTTIDLGRSDVVEYERRATRRHRGAPGTPPAGLMPWPASRPVVSGAKAGRRDRRDSRASRASRDVDVDVDVDVEDHPLNLAQPLNAGSTLQQEGPSPSPEASADVDRHATHWPEDEGASAQREQMPSPENIAIEQPPHPHRPRSPSKDDFHYGGFVETPTTPHHTPNNNSQTSSPFVPDDISTPQNLQLPARRVDRRPLIRSPLFISQNVSSSPERPPTVALTPRMAARMGMGMRMRNTPSVLFSQPPRRPPPRRAARHHRHQTNSFSFDSSERSSAAYEQERVSSASSHGSATLPAEDVSLHDELRGSSLQSSRNPSGVSMVSQRDHEEHAADISDVSRVTIDSTGGLLVSSPQLPRTLPHPFSSVNRVVSGPSLLGGNDHNTHPATSPVRSHSSMPVRNTTGSSRVSSPATDRQGEINSSPPPRTSFSPMSLVRCARRMLSSHRSRSPEARRDSPGPLSGPHSPSLTPRRDQSRQRLIEVEPQIPSQDYSIYNDSLLSELQPQTPAQLPESRHRSIYHPSYTAPVSGGAARRNRRQEFDTLPERSSPGRQQRRVLRRNMHSVRGPRAASPVGMMQAGFRGLYGGRENGDEEQNWVEGVRFNNAETRLWGARDARNDSRTLRETPEPEDWRVGRR